MSANSLLCSSFGLKTTATLRRGRESFEAPAPELRSWSGFKRAFPSSLSDSLLWLSFGGVYSALASEREYIAISSPPVYLLS